MAEALLSVASIVIALVAAVASWRSALAASRASHHAQVAVQANNLAALHDAYASSDMLDAMSKLRSWQNTYGEHFALEFQRRREVDYGSVAEIDHARRRVSHHFQKIHALLDAGLLDSSVLPHVASRGQVEFVRGVIEPLEAAISSKYDRSSFDALGALYQIPCEVPEQLLQRD